MLTIFIASLVLGLFAGLLAGLFGIGGGLVIVPVLAFFFKGQGFPPDITLLMAVATSLATIALTAVSSVLAHHRLGAVVWAKVSRLSPMIMVGAAAGAVVAKQIPADSLRLVLVAFLLYVGTQMAFQLKPKPGAVKQPLWLDMGAATVIGLMSAIVGIGGGTLTVPYLVYGQLPMRNAVAISSACGLPIALAGTASYALLGWDAANLPEWSLGYVSLPAFAGVGLTSMMTAPIGAKLANKLPAAQLKRYFSVLLWVMAAKLLWH
ncbi:MAG: sulfite exporter TauE/SafE family protein [Methylovulum miyakonense]|uniref:sulfite exporter TauE/SafE family protein n=1 Tax=Methylovulum miyakonense TaxID=645578 RepID=UPI003BB64C5E